MMEGGERVNLDNIKNLLKERNKTVREFEEEVGISRGSFYKWDKHDPSYKTLQKAADVLEVSIEKLIE